MTLADWFDDPPRVDEVDGDWTEDEIRRFEREYERLQEGER